MEFSPPATEIPKRYSNWNSHRNSDSWRREQFDYAHRTAPSNGTHLEIGANISYEKGVGDQKITSAQST